MKNVLRTILLSILLFLILVFLGIKYHWVNLLRDRESHQNITLEIPENINKQVPNNQAVEEKQEFEAEIMSGVQNDSQLARMTKVQIIQLCQNLADKLKSDALQKELFVGDCVVSNYKETIQDSETIQVVPEDIKQLCIQQSQSSGTNLPSLELKLLQGICISNEVNQ